MIKTSRPYRAAAAPAPRPSRIRRDPPPPPRTAAKREDYPDEWETWSVVLGVIAFAVAITVIIIAFSDYTSR